MKEYGVRGIVTRSEILGSPIRKVKEYENNLHLIVLKDKLNEFLPSLDASQQESLQEIINMLGE